MLVVDLRRLGRERRFRLDGTISREAGVWQAEDARPESGLVARLDVQDVAGDVLVQGTMEGALEVACRRCLEPVRVEIQEPLALLYRHGAEPGEEDSYPLPERGREIDLEPALREHWLLSAPAYVLCRDDCRGLCPRCGKNLNEGACECTFEETDSRWVPLLRLKDE